MLHNMILDELFNLTNCKFVAGIMGQSQYFPK